MKVCYFLPIYQQSTDTHHRHLYELLERLSYRLDLLVVTRSPEEHVVLGRAEVILLRSTNPLAKLVEYVSVLLKAHRAGYRTIYVHYQVLVAMLAIVLTRLRGGRTLFWSCVEVHEYFAPWSFRLSDIWRKLAVDWPMMLTLRYVDRLVTCSAFMQDYFVKKIGTRPERTVWIHNWVNLQRFSRTMFDKDGVRERLGLPEGASVILYAHALTEHRGALDLPTIMLRVLTREPDAVMLVAGNGPAFGQLKAEIRRLGLADRIRLLGGIPNDHLPEYFASADLFINPTYREAFGRVLLESMAMGVPFVSTDGGGGVLSFTTMAQHEFILPPGDPELFGDAVLRLLDNPSVRSRLVDEGLRHVQSFDLPSTIERFYELLT